MTDYGAIARNCRRKAVELPEKFTKNAETIDFLMRSASAVEELCADLRTCRNELCLRCGKYREAHKGACDGCRWKECPW
jgi:hypothetical protein